VTFSDIILLGGNTSLAYHTHVRLLMRIATKGKQQFRSTPNWSISVIERRQ